MGLFPDFRDDINLEEPDQLLQTIKLFHTFIGLLHKTCSFIVLMPSVRIYDVNSRDHKEKTVNEKACPNFSMLVYVYFIHIILSIYTIHNTYISV